MVNVAKFCKFCFKKCDAYRVNEFFQSFEPQLRLLFSDDTQIWKESHPFNECVF